MWRCLLCNLGSIIHSGIYNPEGLGWTVLGKHHFYSIFIHLTFSLDSKHFTFFFFLLNLSLVVLYFCNLSSLCCILSLSSKWLLNFLPSTNPPVYIFMWYFPIIRRDQIEENLRLWWDLSCFITFTHCNTDLTIKIVLSVGNYRGILTSKSSYP